MESVLLDVAREPSVKGSPLRRPFVEAHFLRVLS